MQRVYNFKRPVVGSWTAFVWLMGCVLSLLGTAHSQVPKRFPIMPEQVRLAMQERNWPLIGVQIRLAAPITATVGEPTLEIASVTFQAEHQAMLRMRCRVQSECLPFYAVAEWPAEVIMPKLLAATGERPISVLSGQNPKAQKRDVVELPAGGSANAVLEPTAACIGRPATLILEGERIHIQIPVIFAQSGHVGDRVRVTSPDHKQVYVAEVLSSEVLKGDVNP